MVVRRSSRPGSIAGELREDCHMEVGDRMLIWCDGGPSMCRAVVYPPPLEIDIDDGMYVLVDDGDKDRWRYKFVSGNADPW